MTEPEQIIGQILPAVLPLAVAALHKIANKTIPSTSLPIILTITGAGAGVLFGLGVIQGVTLAWAAIGAHQTWRKSKKLLGK